MSYCSCLAVVVPPQTGGRSRTITATICPLEAWPARTLLLGNSFHYHTTGTDVMNSVAGEFANQRNMGRRKHSANSKTSNTFGSVKNNIPDYHFSHLLHTGDHITNYRRTCSSISSMPPTYVTTTARRTLDMSSNHHYHNNKTTHQHNMDIITKKHPLRERPTERRSAEVNYVLFQYPNHNDNSFSYRPLLFARGSFPGNSVSKLLAEYWSSASSTVESVMKVRGSGVSKEREISQKESLAENKEESYRDTSLTKSITREEPKETLKYLEPKSTKEPNPTVTTNNRCHCTLTKKPPLDLPCTSSNKTKTKTCDLHSTGDHSNKLRPKSSTIKSIDHDYPIFTTTTTATTTNEREEEETTSDHKKLVSNSVYSNPFEYSKEGVVGGEESHKTSGRLLVARMRAISDSGITNDRDCDHGINDMLQSKSLLKSNSSQTMCVNVNDSNTKQDLKPLQSKTVHPSNSLPNVFNISHPATQQRKGGTMNHFPPPIGYYNRDLLYVGIEPAGCKASSASTEINVPVSVSARVKHRLTLNTSLIPDTNNSTSNYSTNNDLKKQSMSTTKRRHHTARCFKRSLHRRRVSVTNKWIFVDSYTSSNNSDSQRMNLLPTLDDVLNAE